MQEKKDECKDTVYQKNNVEMLCHSKYIDLRLLCTRMAPDISIVVNDLYTLL